MAGAAVRVRGGAGAGVSDWRGLLVVLFVSCICGGAAWVAVAMVMQIRRRDRS